MKRSTRRNASIAIALIIATVLSCALLVVLAHPGRTDGSGGHYNRSTGEYHYHHGYSAHQHYDMDGDGDRDCPYKFKDNTNHSSSTAAGNSSSSANNTQTSKVNNKDNWKKTESDDSTDVLHIIEAIVSVIVLAVCILFKLPDWISFGRHNKRNK